MMLPYDPMLSLLVVVGVFVYFALKGMAEKNNSRGWREVQKTPDQLRDEEYKRQKDIVSWYEKGYTGRCHGEYARYVLWLYQHRDGRQPPTIEEIVEDYGRRREAERKAREEKRLCDWQLFKQSPEYKKEMKRIEEYLSR